MSVFTLKLLYKKAVGMSQCQCIVTSTACSALHMAPQDMLVKNLVVINILCVTYKKKHAN